MKKLFILSICLILAAASLTLAQTEPATLRFWTRLADNPQVQQVVDEWNAEHPDIQIEYEGIPSADYRTKLLAAVAGGTAPDIVGLDVAIMPQYSGLDALLPLDDYISDDLRADFPEGLWFSSIFDGQTVAVPWWSDPSAMFYNIDLFEQAGVEPPETWEELKAAAAAISDLSDDAENDIFGATNVVIVPGNLFTWLPYFWGAGGELLDENNCAAFNTEAGAGAMQLWVDIVQAGDMPRSAIYGENSEPVQALFFSNRLGMYTSGPSLYRRAMEINPDLNIGSIVMPRSETGQHSSYLGGDNLVILNTSEHPDEAWQFIEYMIDSERMQTLAAENNGIYIEGLITRTSAFADDHFERWPYQRGFVEAQQYGRTPNSTLISEIRVPLWENFQAAQDGAMTVQEALDDAEMRVNEITGCTS
jgi:ABC-type glycerol-3-phosphate transport system substrate-binding protein